MWELDCKESWVLKNWCFWTVVLEKTLESPLDCKEIQPVHPQGNQSWIFIGRTDAEAETPILWPPDAKNWLIEKDPDAGKDWRWEEKGMTEDEMVGWHHWLDGHKFRELVMDREAWCAAIMGSQRVRQDWATELNWYIRCMKRCSTWLMIREVQIKTTVRYHLTPVSMAILKKTTNNKHQQRCGEMGILVHCWNVIWCSHCRKITIVWSFLKKTKTRTAMCMHAKWLQSCPTLRSQGL